jgi:hypothetical protein
MYLGKRIPPASFAALSAFCRYPRRSKVQHVLEIAARLVPKNYREQATFLGFLLQEFLAKQTTKTIQQVSQLFIKFRLMPDRMETRVCIVVLIAEVIRRGCDFQIR